MHSRRLFIQSLAASMVAGVAPTAAATLDTNGYNRDSFTHGRITLPLWIKGQGPQVFIFHEMTGLTQDCFTLGNDLVMKEFSVVIPEFFGSAGGGFAGYFKACEFKPLFDCYTHDDPGRIGSWVKALAVDTSDGARFGAIGNCMTGALPLLMLRSRYCVAPVLCQPSYPFPSALRDRGYKDAVGLAAVDLAYARLRTERDTVPVLGIRYENDSLCPRERFRTLAQSLAHFHCIEIGGDGHSTLIGHRCAAAFDAVVSFLQHRLMGAAWTAPASRCERRACAPSSTNGAH